MDPVTIAAGVMSVLAPFAIQGAKAFGEGVGEAALSQAKKIIETLKRRWSSDKEAGSAVENFETKPARYQGVLQDLLEEKLRQDPELAAELQGHLERMGPDLKIVQEVYSGRDLTAVKAKTMSSGSLEATQRVTYAENAKVLDIDTIG